MVQNKKARQIVLARVFSLGLMYKYCVCVFKVYVKGRNKEAYEKRLQMVEYLLFFTTAGLYCSRAAFQICSYTHTHVCLEGKIIVKVFSFF